MFLLGKNTFSELARSHFEQSRTHSRERTMEAHEELRSGLFRPELLRLIFRSTDRFAYDAANSHDRKFQISKQDQIFLSYCAAANIFRSATPGYWAEDRSQSRNVLLRAGLTLPEEDIVMNTLRAQYQRPGVLRSPDSMSPRYERNISAAYIAKILGDNHTFYLDSHILPLDETRWTTVAAPFYEEVLTGA